MNKYKIGDRVRLVTNGMYMCCKAGQLGTVVETYSGNNNCVKVAVDGSVNHKAGLNFYTHEIEPASKIPMTIIDKDGDSVVVMSNGGTRNELYIKANNQQVGTIITKQQALELAAAIQTFYS